MDKIDKADEELKYCYKYPHPSVTTDCVIFGFDGTKLRVLLVQRGIEPYKGRWAFPGGFMQMDESAEEGALRELQEEKTSGWGWQYSLDKQHGLLLAAISKRN